MKQQIQGLRANIQKCFLGNQQAIDKVLTCLLAGGHLLIEDVPGVGKTMLASSLARSLKGRLSRIQMTPDMLPADVLGVTVWDQQQARFEFNEGPVFANVVLADEINRTTPRTQSALLEAMSEAQVSIDGKTRQLPRPFLVIATQNPFEFEGTYFLPESQLDRFMMRVKLGYPAAEDEARILTIDPSRSELEGLQPVMTQDELVQLQAKVQDVQVDQALVQYVVQLASATRTHEQLQIGVSPRGSLALMHAAKAAALMHGRDYVVPDDIVSNVLPVFGHRVITRGHMHDGDALSGTRVMQQVLETVPSPV
jgi:MoxR-like ATPase